MTNHQDWNTVVIKRDKPSKSSAHYQGSELKKMDQETDVGRHVHVGSSLGRQIQTARIAKGYSKQSDLAKALNLRPDVITLYESGKAIPDNAVMQKLRRVLNIKLMLSK